MLTLGFGILARIVKRVYLLDLAIQHVNAINDMIHTGYSFHIEDGCDVVTLDNVLL